jgi:hypothetical protein
VPAATIGLPVFGIPVRFQRAELAAHADLSPAADALLKTARGPEDILEGLHRSGSHRDFLAALAMMLPKRQGVWWACLAARLLGPAKGSPETAAIHAAEAWVQAQSEETREASAVAAEALDHEGAAAWAALAAYWSGGSIGAAGAPPVAPAPHLTGTAVRCALFMTAAAQPSAWEEMVAIGVEILAGETGRKAFAEAAASGEGTA